MAAALLRSSCASTPTALATTPVDSTLVARAATRRAAARRGGRRVLVRCVGASDRELGGRPGWRAAYSLGSTARRRWSRSTRGCSPRGRSASTSGARARAGRDGSAPCRSSTRTRTYGAEGRGEGGGGCGARRRVMQRRLGIGVPPDGGPLLGLHCKANSRCGAILLRAGEGTGVVRLAAEART